MILFTDFWDAYPRKVGRVQAERTWQRMKDREREAAMMGLELWKQTVQWETEHGKFIPYGSTFLNQRRYLDELSGEARREGRNAIRPSKPMNRDYLEFVALRDAGKLPKGMTWEVWRKLTPKMREEALRAA